MLNTALGDVKRPNTTLTSGVKRGAAPFVAIRSRELMVGDRTISEIAGIAESLNFEGYTGGDRKVYRELA